MSNKRRLRSGLACPHCSSSPYLTRPTCRLTAAPRARPGQRTALAPAIEKRIDAEIGQNNHEAPLTMHAGVDADADGSQDGSICMSGPCPGLDLTMGRMPDRGGALTKTRRGQRCVLLVAVLRADMRTRRGRDCDCDPAVWGSGFCYEHDWDALTKKLRRLHDTTTTPRQRQATTNYSRSAHIHIHTLPLPPLYAPTTHHAPRRLKPAGSHSGSDTRLVG